MRIVIALALLTCFSCATYASSKVVLRDNKIILPNGNVLPFEADSDKLVVSSQQYGDMINVQHMQKGQQRVIVELHNAPLVPHLKTFKHTISSLSQANMSSSFRQQQIVVESSRYTRKLVEEQHSAWSAIRNVANSAKVHKKHSKLLNALIIDIDAQHIDKLRQIPEVKRVSAQKIVYKSLTESVAMVNAPAVWSLRDKNSLSVTGHGINVAVLDTGIDYTHPALGGCFGAGCKVVAGYDFHNQDNDPMDGDGHGTHVAGIIAAQTDNYSGVAPNVNLHAYKVLSDDGSGFDTTIIAALEYALDPDGDPNTDDAIDVINMSLGGTGDANDPLSRATNAAVAAGIIVVVAAGNNAGFGDIATSSPASAADAITVASTTKSDDLSYFSSKGESARGAALKPDISAPGSNIVAPYLNHNTSSLDGTSMASPHVAGAAALLKQLYPTASVADVRGMLMAGSVDLGLLPYEQGAGRLDIEAASQATMYSKDGILAFGQIDTQAQHWQSTLPLTLYNISSQDQPISLELSDNFAATMPQNVTISWPDNDYIIPANGSLIINITLDATDPQSVVYPENGAFVFTERLIVRSMQHALTVPVTLENAMEMTLHMDEAAGGYLWLYSDDFSFNRNFQLTANTRRTIKVPQSMLTAVLNYDWLEQTKFPAFALPENTTVFAFDIRKIDPAFDTDVSFTLNAIDTFIGFDKLLDANGLELGSDDLNLSNSTDGNVYFGDIGSYGFFSFGFPKVYIGFSSQSEITHADYSTYGFLPNHAEREDQLRVLSIQKNIDSFSPGLHSITASLDALRNIEVLLPDYEVEGNQSVYYYNINSGGGGIIDIKESEASAVMVSVIPELAIHNRFSVGLAEPKEVWHDNLITSPLLRPTEGSGISADSRMLNSRFSYLSDDIDLGHSGTFFSGTVYFQNGSLQVEDTQYMPEWSVVHDINLNSYGRAPTAMQFSWLCELEMVEQYNVYPEPGVVIAIPELPCSLPTLSISFNNWLQGAVYRSSLNAEKVDTNNIFIDAINRVSVIKAGNNVDDQIVNRLDSLLVIDAPNHAYNLRAQMQLGTDEYIELIKSEDLSNEMQASFSLPMFFGKHVASVRIIYGYNEEYSQTLNGLFMLGADAGDGDVDGDGTPNIDDADNDNDGMPDGWEAQYGLNPLNASDADTDNDNDGLTNLQEFQAGTHPNSADTDGDGMPDGWEVHYGLNPLDASDADTDNDNDGLTNLQEFQAGTNPNNADTDDDGMPDGWEVHYGLNPLNASDTDSDMDNDGFTALQEYQKGTNPNVSDKITPPATPVPADSGGGSLSLLWLMLLLITMYRRQLLKNIPAY
ncbi:S8 family peptidase [Arsukibacterium perlucidum]|uniref:S8 family peptidase n=1 Tax=Arsukibacterium perlucidum TaxID=368811 RepID=UPI000382B01C|nr:S8 family serine peptidase [Arsukibacterium perlucidum]